MTSETKRPRRQWDRDKRRRNDIDDAHALDADQEYAKNEKEYQDWLARHWDRAEGYEKDDDPNAYDPDDPGDNRLLVPDWERGRLP